VIRVLLFTILGFVALFALALYNHWTTPERLLPLAVVLISALGGACLSSARVFAARSGTKPPPQALHPNDSRRNTCPDSDGSEALARGFGLSPGDTHPRGRAPLAPYLDAVVSDPERGGVHIDRIIALLLVLLGAALLLFALILYLYLFPGSPSGPIRWGGPIIEGQIV